MLFMDLHFEKWLKFNLDNIVPFLDVIFLFSKVFFSPTVLCTWNELRTKIIGHYMKYRFSYKFELCLLTIQYMNEGASRLCVIRYARIISGMLRTCTGYIQGAHFARQVRCDINSSIIIIVDHSIIVIPEHVNRRLRTLK